MTVDVAGLQQYIRHSACGSCHCGDGAYAFHVTTRVTTVVSPSPPKQNG